MWNCGCLYFSRSNNSADVLDDTFERQRPSVDADGACWADEGRGFTLNVTFVAFDDGVGLTVLSSARCAGGFVGK